LTEFADRLGATHEVKSYFIKHLDIKPCIGCLKCRPDKVCVLSRDDGHRLAEKLAACDLLIIGSPTWWGNMPGQLKIFFDRNVALFEYAEAKSMRRFRKPKLKGKKAIIVSSSAAPFPLNQFASQSRGTIRAIKTILNGGGIKIIKIINVADSYNFEAKKERYLKKVEETCSKINMMQ
jgi:putative NADPH-quinone reductase